MEIKKQNGKFFWGPNLVATFFGIDPMSCCCGYGKSEVLHLPLSYKQLPSTVCIVNYSRDKTQTGLFP
jgi:hypothetical protein